MKPLKAWALLRNPGRDWRGFFLLLLAGGRPVVMNADFRGGRLRITPSSDGRIFNCKFGAEDGEPKQDIGIRVG